MNGMKNNKRNRKMFGYMISPPQPQAKATKHMDTQTEESSQAQLYEIQTPSQPSPPVDQAKLTRKELKARGACLLQKWRTYYSPMPQEASRPNKEESCQAWPKQ
jgi:hypothetical protein